MDLGISMGSGPSRSYAGVRSLGRGEKPDHEVEIDDSMVGRRQILGYTAYAQERGKVAFRQFRKGKEECRGSCIEQGEKEDEVRKKEKRRRTIFECSLPFHPAGK
jgi:hypothetical protein